MPKRTPNLLALAVLSLLRERPMHPYDLAATMRYRELSSVVKLTTGTLYSVIEALQRDGLITPVGTQRHGQYPERTVYALTDAGQAALFDWLRALLRAPSAEYPAFAASNWLGQAPGRGERGFCPCRRTAVPSGSSRWIRTQAQGPQSIVVDLGAGSGAFALAVAPLCRRVIAVDISPVMVAALRAAASARGLDNIESVLAGFLTYAHQGDPADVVYSRHALHHLPDFWKAVALAQVASIMPPGGVLRLRDLVYACEPDEIADVIEPWLAAGAARPEEGWTRPELETHVREEYSPFSWALEAMLEHVGFQIQQAEYDASRIYAAYTCVKR